MQWEPHIKEGFERHFDNLKKNPVIFEKYYGLIHILKMSVSKTMCQDQE